MMRTSLFTALSVVPLLLFGNSDSPSPDAVWRSDFANPKLLEKSWQFEGAKFLVPKTRFFLAEAPESSLGRVMVIEAKKSTGVLMTAPKKVDLKKRPLLRWRWRVVRPVKVQRGKTEPDDQAAVIYFGDGTLLKQRCVGYRWERNTPVGTSGILRYAAGMMTVKFFCIRNRETPENVWVTEERDVVGDYIEAFGSEPDDYFILSVGANTQYSESDTRVEIDFIEFVPRPEAER